MWLFSHASIVALLVWPLWIALKLDLRGPQMMNPNDLITYQSDFFSVFMRVATIRISMKFGEVN